MGLRKLFSFTKKPLDLSSFVNEWVKENQIDDRFDINIRKIDNNLSFSLANGREPKTVKIEIDKMSVSLLNKKITGYYFKNYDYINLTGANCVTKLDEIKRLLDRFSSLEIVEVSEHKIVLKEMLNPKDLNAKTIILEMIELEKVLFNELSKPENNQKLDFAQSIDLNINKLTYLGYKALNYNLETIMHPSELQRTVLYWRTLAALEDIGDLLKRIARYLKAKEPNSPIIGELMKDVKNYYVMVTSHLYKKKSTFEDKLEEYLMKKESILRSFEMFVSNSKNNLNLALVLVQLLKDILGQIGTLVFVLIEFE